MTAGPVIIRPLESQDDYLQCTALQREIWGPEFSEGVPPSLLMATQKVGGVAAGAFDRGGRLLGFVFGLSGIRAGRPAHWSDMLAVREDARGLGLAVRLKMYQRQELLRNGIEVALWSYDPLEARNAHINLNRLGARPIEYVSDMYGEATGSALHAGLPTDRLLVEWELRDPRVETLVSGEALPATWRAPGAPIVNTVLSGGTVMPRAPELPDAPEVRVEIPADLQSVKRGTPELARTWRMSTRRAFTHYMNRSYRVVGFAREPETNRCFYLLARA